MSSASELRHRLQFSLHSEHQDGYGNFVGEWVAQFTVSAKVKYLRGTESVMAARLEGRQPILITLRNCISARRITSDWRALDVRTGVLFAIKEPPRLTDDRAFLEMFAESGVAA